MDQPLKPATSSNIAALRESAMQTSASVLRLQRQSDQALRQAKAALEAESRALAATASMLSATLEASVDGIVVVDLLGRVVIHNQNFARMWQVPAALLARADDAELLAHMASQMPDAAEFRCLAQVPSAQPRQHDRHVFDLPDGRCLERIESAQIINGERVGAVICWRDLTEQRQAAAARADKERAEAANLAKTQFISRMSHELRTPLNAVLCFTQVMLDDRSNPLAAPQREQATHVYAAGQHLHALISDLLDMARLEMGQMRVDCKPFRLEPMIDEVLEMLAPIAQPLGVSILPFAPPRQLSPVTADATRVRQVLFNLLSNAVKYNRAEGSVSVELSERSGELEVVIRDTGIGMTAQQLAHLYEPYNRLGRESGRIEGVGIGMTVTRALVELMHGRISVTSTPDRGTRFAVVLPVAATEDATDFEVPSGPLQLEANEVAGLVLSIEDNPVNQLIVEALFSRWPAVQLLSATTGEQGLEMARAYSPDLVLLDMSLPDMGGLEIMARLCADPRTKPPRVLVLSADALPQTVALAREQGAVAYMTKPIDTREFRARVSSLLDGCVHRAGKLP